jgi:outer membrane protein assembly factor BamA
VEAVAMTAPPKAGQPSAEQPMRARVGLEEWPPIRVRYGLELSDEQKPAGDHRTLQPGVASDLTYRNLFGLAASAGLAARYTKDFRATRGYLTIPAFFGLPLTSNLFLARSREQTGESAGLPIVVDRSDFTAEQRFRVRGRLQMAYSYNFERNRTFDVNARPEDPFAYDLTVNIARLMATGLFDSRDDLVDATRGMFFTSTFEQGVAALGSDLRFAKQFVEQTYYRTLGRRVVFATAARLGLGAGYGQDLIPSERFFAGGGNSVRGYAEGSLGPRSVFGDAAGGNAELVLNEELRFPVFWRLRGVAFVDAGNVFATVGDFALANLRASVGGGLRVQTPFALLRVDLGAPINRRAGESRARWFFSIGQMF